MRTNAGNPIYLMADHHGSHQVAVSPTSWAVTRRYLDPYGNQLGTGTGTWPTTHGFLDKPQSSITGLSDLGARKYDPKIGRFLSVDPLLFPDNPALLNGYNYVGNNPVGYSDPSGLGPNPDSPVKPPCVPTIQNCGPRGDGVSNGYEHKPSQVPAQTQELIDEEIKNRIDEGQDPETARTQAYQNAIEQNTFAYELKDQILADYCTWADDAICHPASGFEVAVAATAFVPVTWGPRAGLALTGLGARIFGGGATKIAANGGTDVVRHYTTREAAESIMKGGQINPGKSGKIWITPEKFASGAQARAKLSLDKTPDGYFEIPMCRIHCPSAPSKVEPWAGQPGGGIEITTEFPIDIRGLIFRGFE